MQTRNHKMHAQQVLLEVGATRDMNIYKLSPRCSAAPGESQEGLFERLNPLVSSTKDWKSLSLPIVKLRVKVSDAVNGGTWTSES